MARSVASFAATRCVWLLGCGFALAGLLTAAGCSSKDSAAQEKNTPAAAAPVKELSSADEVLAAMAEAYRNAKSYSDKGKVRFVVDSTDPNQSRNDVAKFSVRFERPNKLRVEAYEARIVVDGARFRAAREDAEGQYVDKAAPNELNWNMLFADPYLAQATRMGFGGDPPQLTLLLEKDALRAVLGEGDKPTLAEPGEIGGNKCYRIKVRRQEGALTFWIDMRSFLLRRFEYPTDELYHVYSRQSPVKSISMAADFEDAEINGAVEATAWQFAPPAGAVACKFLVPPHPAQLLTKQVPDFKFVDLKQREYTRQSLAGKIVVLEFWGTQCPPCRQALPMMDKVHQGYQGSNVEFFAINVDPAETPDEELTSVFQKLNVNLPIARMAPGDFQQLFRTEGIPFCAILDAKGVVQDIESGPNADLATDLPAKLEKLRAGEDVYQPALKKYQEQMAQHEKFVALVEQGLSPNDAANQLLESQKTPLAPRSEPRRLRITQLWSNKDVKGPVGNLLVVADGGGPAKIAVVEGCKGVVEIGMDGKTLEHYPLLPEASDELVTTLRTATGKDGQRYYAAFGVTHQRLHCTDAKWKTLFSFPADALENRHSGIADVQLADLEGDGQPELYVSYYGPVGVQAVSLEGKRTGAYRALANVMRMAVGGPSQNGARPLYCVNNAGPFTLLDARLQRLGEVAVQDWNISWIVAAELTGNPQPQFCGLAVPRPGETIAVGFDGAGQQLWEYKLPEGFMDQSAIEPILAGRLTGATGQWILPGCDGSIHILSPEGQLIDRFHYGKPLAGLATAEIDGKPALIVATPDGVDAWRVE